MDVLQGDLDSKTWCQKIRALREEKGWSQGDLAGQLGVHPQAISEIERGKERMTLERLNRILDTLGYSARVMLKERRTSTRAEWGPLLVDEPSRRRVVREARRVAEELAEELYRQFQVDRVYCFGSLVENGGADFTKTSDLDLLVEGLGGRDLFSVKSALEINVLEPPDEFAFSFDLVLAQDFDDDPEEMVRKGRAVFIPRVRE